MYPKNSFEYQSKFIEFDGCRMAYFFWDEEDSSPIGNWSTKEEAALQRERYCAWVASDQYPDGDWEEYK